MADELGKQVENEVFEAMLKYLEEQPNWENLEGDELAQFKEQMLEDVCNDPSKIHNVADVDVEELSELTDGEPITNIAETYKRYWYYVGASEIEHNWEGIILRWEYYTRPFSSDEEEEEEDNNNN